MKTDQDFEGFQSVISHLEGVAAQASPNSTRPGGTPFPENIRKERGGGSAAIGLVTTVMLETSDAGNQTQ